MQKVGCNPVMVGGGQIYFLLGNTTDKRFNDRPERRIQRMKSATGLRRLIRRVLGPPSVLSGLSGRYLTSVL